jgi:N-acetylglucosaminyldiphosphoundecaprenol N-acetyl-beta-D-mannosaminyltransferase
MNCNILDLEISTETYVDTFAHLAYCLDTNNKNHLATLNSDILRLASDNPHYKNIIKKFDLIIADGMPLVWYSKLTDNHIKERIAGRKLVYDLFELSHNKGYRIFILGCQKGVSDIAVEKLKKILPNIQIGGTYSPEPLELEDDLMNDKIVNIINMSKSQILFVALGAPKQEFWLYKNKNKLDATIAIPCGGSIDFIAGVQKKAPEWMGNIGNEWFYRFLTNPIKFCKRYFILDLPFLIKLFVKKFFVSQNSFLKSEKANLK